MRTSFMECSENEYTQEDEDCKPYLSLVLRKPVFGVSDQGSHKPGCTVTEGSKKLEILYLGSRGIVLAM